MIKMSKNLTKERLCYIEKISSSLEEDYVRGFWGGGYKESDDDYSESNSGNLCIKIILNCSVYGLSKDDENIVDLSRTHASRNELKFIFKIKEDKIFTKSVLKEIYYKNGNYEAMKLLCGSTIEIDDTPHIFNMQILKTIKNNVTKLLKNEYNFVVINSDDAFTNTFDIEKTKKTAEEYAVECLPKCSFSSKANINLIKRVFKEKLDIEVEADDFINISDNWVYVYENEENIIASINKMIKDISEMSIEEATMLPDEFSIVSTIHKKNINALKTLKTVKNFKFIGQGLYLESKSGFCTEIIKIDVEEKKINLVEKNIWHLTEDEKTFIYNFYEYLQKNLKMLYQLKNEKVSKTIIKSYALSLI
jgi:hypothetical protein